MSSGTTAIRMPNFFEYFFAFMTSAPWLSRIAMLAYFVMYLINPVLGRSSPEQTGALMSGARFAILGTILFLASMSVYLFNRNLTGQKRRTGVLVFLIMILPVFVSLIALLLGALAEGLVAPVIIAASSLHLVFPLLLMVIILMEGVIHFNNQEAESVLLIVFTFVAMLLMVYTFACLYYVNGLVTIAGSEALPTFYDVFYFSGVTWTTLGYGDMVPVGAGKMLAVFESMLGWVLMSLMTAIFLRVLVGGEK